MRPKARTSRKFWLVSVDRTTVYRVYAKDEAEALDLFSDANEVDAVTTDQRAAVDEDQTRHDRRVETWEA
jgi:hypothetical protein